VPPPNIGRVPKSGMFWGCGTHRRKKIAVSLVEEF